MISETQLRWLHLKMANSPYSRGPRRGVWCMRTDWKHYSFSMSFCFLLDPVARKTLCWALVTNCVHIARQHHFSRRYRATKNPGLDWNGVGRLSAGCETGVPKCRPAIHKSRQLHCPIGMNQPPTFGYIVCHVPQPKDCYTGTDARQTGTH